MSTPSGSIVIVGASSGIGAATARLLAEENRALALTTRRPSDLPDHLAGHPVYELDASNWDDVDAVFESIATDAGRIDGVVHCAGSVFLKPAHLTSEEEYRRVLDTNLSTAFAVVRSATRHMMKTGGDIVLISSAAARIGLANHEAIAAAKAGVIGLVQSAAATYARQNIRVNGVAPGLVRTPGTKRLTGNEASVKASEAMHPLGRIGEPEDIARCITWLLDAGQSWLTGEVIGVDGGLSHVKPLARGGS